ncbi:MAG: hypothetical protein HKN79_02700 [Flavobacteriales bacterium]|nr:hypothetical protein [Flavobacteriales bacterium]
MKNLLYAFSLLFVFASCEKEDDEPNNNSSGPDTPIAIQLESIVMTGFEPTDSSGDYWDSSTNPGDPYVEVFKSGALVYTSYQAQNPDHNATYPLNDAASGALPILYTEGESMTIHLQDLDSGTAYDFMGSIVIDDAMSFFYNGDEAEEFINVPVSTSNGYVDLELSGTILY